MNDCNPTILLQESVTHDGWEVDSIINHVTEFTDGLYFISYDLLLTLICDCECDEPAYKVASFLKHAKVGVPSSVGVVVEHSEALAIDAWIKQWHRSMDFGEYVGKMFGYEQRILPATTK
jgi:hypothetical protein